jgi:hypothetical protein
MTQPQTTAKKTTKRSMKATEAKMAKLAKEGGAILDADAKKAKRKTATRKKAAAKKAPAKKTAAKRKAPAAKAQAPAKPAAPNAPAKLAAPTAPAKPAAPKEPTTSATAKQGDQTPKRGRRATPGKDPRIPPVGTKIVRPYKGEEYEVTVLADGFRWNDGVYSSLSKLASTITGAKAINGLLWFRLTEPKKDEGSSESAD